MARYDLKMFHHNKAFLHREEGINGKIEIGNHFCINTKGEVLFTLPDKKMICLEFKHPEFASVSLESKDALINSKGEFITDFIYDFIHIEDEIGYFGIRKDGKDGVIDINGNEVVPCIYTDGFYMEKDYAIFELNGKKGMIDYNNNVLIPFEYEDLWGHTNGLMVAKRDGKYGIIYKENQVVIDFKYDDMIDGSEDDSNTYIAKKNGKWGIIDKEDNILEPFIFDNADGYSELCTLKKDGKYALYSCLNKQFVSEFIFEKANNSFSSSNCFGFAENYNKNDIKLHYDEFFQNFFDTANEGIAIIRKGGKYGAIDKDWNVVIPFEYEKLGRCSDGLMYARIFEDNESGYIDKNNNDVIPIGKYYHCSNFRCGVAIVSDKKLGRVYINTKGEIIQIKEV